MKPFFIALLLTACFAATAQEAAKFRVAELSNSRLLKTETKLKFAKKDLAELFTHTTNAFVYGFIGDKYQRIRIKFTSVKKDPRNPFAYLVTGKSMVKSNIDDFNGTLKISTVRQFKKVSSGLDDEYAGQGIKGEYLMVGEYTFSENNTQPHSGVFKGSFSSGFYVDKNGQIVYDNIDMNADGYSNNKFVGQWVSHDGKIVQACNWGDYRVPYSEDLDIGAGEFSPNDKYLANGWQSLRDTFSDNVSVKTAATKTENSKWWEEE